MDKTYEKIVYFVRHGESEGNISPMFQPPDSPLTDTGREQAKCIADRISKLSFETLIASSLPRAKETAEIIAEATNKKIEYSDLFVERKKPTRTMGKVFDDIEISKLWEEYEKSLYTNNLRVDNWENYDDIVGRANEALDFLKNRKEKTMVVVTHGFFLRTIIACVILDDLLTPEIFKSFQSRMHMENVGLSALRYTKENEESAWHLWIYNDHAHLG